MLRSLAITLALYLVLPHTPHETKVHGDAIDVHALMTAAKGAPRRSAGWRPTR